MVTFNGKGVNIMQRLAPTPVVGVAILVSISAVVVDEAYNVDWFS
jgi:hypothetical protein